MNPILPFQVLVTGVTDWSNAAALEVVSPLWPYTVVFAVLAIFAWLAWQVWQVIAEHREYNATIREWTAELPEDIRAIIAELSSSSENPGGARSEKRS